MGCGTHLFWLGASYCLCSPTMATAQRSDSNWRAAIKGGAPAPSPSAFDAETVEPRVEARKLTTRIDQALLTAGPCRMRFRIDVEAQRVTRFSIGRSRLIRGPVGHDDRNLMIVGVNAVFHLTNPQKAPSYSEAPGAMQRAGQRTSRDA